MPFVRIQRKGQMTLPTGVRTAVGLADGDLVDVRVSGRRVIITPTLVIDRSTFPTADDDYTPEQRRLIDARLDKAEKARRHGPFKSAEDAVAQMKAELKKRAAARKLKPAK
jgi:AbrB family looped-hinge helix DNA binding protein